MMTRTERFAEYLKSILPSLAVSAAIWLVLQSAACMGFRPFFLRSLQAVKKMADVHLRSTPAILSHIHFSKQVWRLIICG